MVVKACDECKTLNTKRKLYNITEGSSAAAVFKTSYGDTIMTTNQSGFKVLEDVGGGFESQQLFKTLCRECLNTEIERLLDAEGK